MFAFPHKPLQFICHCLHLLQWDLQGKTTLIRDGICPSCFPVNGPLTVNHSSVKTIFTWFSRVVVKEGFCCNACGQTADVACCKHLLGSGGGGGYKMCVVSLTCCIVC